MAAGLGLAEGEAVDEVMDVAALAKLVQSVGEDLDVGRPLLKGPRDPILLTRCM